MQLLATFVERYPIVIVVAMLIALVLFTAAADWFVGLAERDPVDGKVGR